MAIQHKLQIENFNSKVIKFPINKDFKPYYKIPKPQTGRRFVITDIHGFFDTFQSLLSQIKLKKEDQLFILGDMIDKGKKGKEILDLILSLIDDGYSIFPLRGNHEDMLLKSHNQDYNKDMLWLPTLRKSKGIRDKYNKILPKYLRLIEKLPFYYELDNFFLVHAGFDFSNPKPFENYKSMIWISEFSVDNAITNKKKVIHGHSQRQLSFIRKTIDNKENKIGLDNNTMRVNNEYFGNLVCLNLDTYELIIQPNIDKKR